MSAGCDDHCDVNFEGLSPHYRRILMFVAAINLAMFLVEIIGGHLAESVALQADALDFLADSLTYAVSLWAIGKPIKLRATAAFYKGLSLGAMAIYVAGSTIYRVFVLGVPEAYTMSIVGALALATNVLSVLLLYKWRNGDANVRSVWLCSRNDAIGNVAVIGAAFLVFWTGTGWPDIAVAGFMSVLFLNSSWQILRRSIAELNQAKISDDKNNFSA